jgi:hypothetical protein
LPPTNTHEPNVRIAFGRGGVVDCLVEEILPRRSGVFFGKTPPQIEKQLICWKFVQPQQFGSPELVSVDLTRIEG